MNITLHKHTTARTNNVALLIGKSWYNTKPPCCQTRMERKSFPRVLLSQHAVDYAMHYNITMQSLAEIAFHWRRAARKLGLNCVIHTTLYIRVLSW